MNNKKVLLPIFNQLAITIDAGIPLVLALQLVADSAEHEDSKKILLNVKETIEKGKTLADAMSEHPDFFDKYSVALVNAGEVGGILDTILNRLARDIEWEISFELKIEKALGAKVMADVDWIKKQLEDKISETEFDKLILGMPNFGQIILQLDTIRFCRILGSLIACGTPILDAFEVCIDTAHNKVVKEALRNTRSGIMLGTSISGPLKKTGLFPAIFIGMVQVGENTGAMDVTLTKIAEYFDFELDRNIDELLGKNL